MTVAATNIHRFLFGQALQPDLELEKEMLMLLHPNCNDLPQSNLIIKGDT